MEEKEEKKPTDLYVPAVVAITLRSTSKGSAVIQTQIIRAPMKGEPEGFFAEIDNTLKNDATNHAIELGGVVTLPRMGKGLGLYIHLVLVSRQEPLSADQSGTLEKVTAPAPEPGKE